MAKDATIDTFEEALRYWNQAALLLAKRVRLMNPERYPEQLENEPREKSPPVERHSEHMKHRAPSPAVVPPPPQASSEAEGLPPNVPRPPPTFYKVITIYRYTRGNNDLANPGMGYGELTREKCWQKKSDGEYHLVDFHVRRTRSARQRIDPDSNRRGNSLKPPAPSADAPVDSKGK